MIGADAAEKVYRYLERQIIDHQGAAQISKRIIANGSGVPMAQLDQIINILETRERISITAAPAGRNRAHVYRLPNYDPLPPDEMDLPASPIA